MTRSASRGSRKNGTVASFFPSPCKGEDQGEGPYPARERARLKIPPPLRAASFVILSAAKNPGSSRRQPPHPQPRINHSEGRCFRKISAPANPGYFAALQNDAERLARISQKQEHGYANLSCKGAYKLGAPYNRTNPHNSKSHPDADDNPIAAL